MSQEQTTSMAVPLDSDGFLRRECPTCERELKWLAASDDEDETPPRDGGYYCPYCAIQAPPDAWFTPVQLEQAQAVVAREFVEPELRRLGGQGFDVEINMPEVAELTEAEDMKRVDFSCHPNEPVKVLDDWDRPIHCPLCGMPASAENPS